MMIRRNILVFIAVVGILASCYVAAIRYAVEAKNRAVEVVVDYEEMSQLAGIEGKSVVEVLSEFKNAGASSCAVSAVYMRDAVENGSIVALGNGRFVSSAKIANELIEWLSVELPVVKEKFAAVEREDGKVEFTVKLPWTYLRMLPIGLGDAPEDVRKVGMMPIVRIPNYAGATAQSVDALLRLVKGAEAETVIFDGDQVLGYNGCEKESGQAFVKNGIYFGYVEFAKQRGSSKLAARAESNMLVVHSITQAEMANLWQSTIVDRFQKAVRERGVRICYVRMYTSAGEDLLKSNLQYLRSIVMAIDKAGYSMKQAHPLEDLRVPRWLRILSGCAVAAGVMLAILSVVKLPSNIFTVLTVVVFMAGIIGSAAGETGRKIVALLGAMAYPTLAVLFSTKIARFDKKTNLYLRLIGIFAVAVGISACGGLLVVGLLSERAFMLRLQTFMGVKLAHFVPVLIMSGVYVAGWGWGPELWEAQKERMLARVREIAANPILVWQAAGAVVVLILLALMLARSGNDSGLEVSTLELRMRSVLDKILYVRPRTKEFLIGYPALICGLGLLLQGRKIWAAPCLVVGSFGLVSALNTFCHIHTPIVLTALRVFNGFWVGLLIGLLVYRVVCCLPGKE